MEAAPDRYRVPARDAGAEIREKGSRFIAEVFRIDSADAADARLERVRRREHAATHHCSAYRLGVECDVFRYDDDGEPSGTAGIPILRQIDARALTNVLVVVTRYFGGTKLGTGGLARAYGAAAADALDEAGAVEREIRTRIQVRFAYDDTAPAMQVINQFGAHVEASEYSTVTELVVAVRRSLAADFRHAFRDALGGRGHVEGAD